MACHPAQSPLSSHTDNAEHRRLECIRQIGPGRCDFGHFRVIPETL